MRKLTLVLIVISLLISFSQTGIGKKYDATIIDNDSNSFLVNDLLIMQIGGASINVPFEDINKVEFDSGTSDERSVIITLKTNESLTGTPEHYYFYNEYKNLPYEIHWDKIKEIDFLEGKNSTAMS